MPNAAELDNLFCSQYLMKRRKAIAFGGGNHPWVTENQYDAKPVKAFCSRRAVYRFHCRRQQR
jgi:hypothetical protein